MNSIIRNLTASMLTLVCFYSHAQVKVFDVHLHGAASISEQLSTLKNNGVYHIAVSTSWEQQQGYVSRDGLNVLHGLMLPCPNGRVPYSQQPCFEDEKEWPSLEWVEAQMKQGKINFLGEVITQYYGIEPFDSLMRPYFSLAEKYKIPVGIHTGSAGPDHGCPNFKEAMGNPELLKPLLNRFPKLKVWMMHAGLPYHDETIGMMKVYPNLYMDISVINNPRIVPPEIFSKVMKTFIDAGFEKRLMFGSDNADIQVTIKSVTSLAFLSENQKQNILFKNAERFFKGK